MKAVQDTTRRPTLREVQRFVQLSTGFWARTIVLSRKTADEKAPILILFHCSGWASGYPEYELDFARQAADATGAVVILPSYRFAPEHPYPAAVQDAWALVQHVALEAAAEPSRRTLLPAHADANAGFVVGGSCAGANMATVAAHLARDTGLEPPLTGQMLYDGWYMFPAKQVPAPYAGRWISMAENTQDPLLPMTTVLGLTDILRVPESAELITPFAWPNWKDGVDEEERVGKGHVGLPPVYFQVSGMGLMRDDTLVYETVLREESGVPTRLDLYPGFPHCGLMLFSHLLLRQKWEADRLAGLTWLLDQAV
ncbi:alpha/beta-hydrolase [Thozetella sp. PMI_491]|nr:alpha/beta-hydrolase [Thozetella sp. PMI_491]